MKYCPECKQQYPKTQRFCLNDGRQLLLRDPYHLVGRIINDRYRLDSLIGIGGMGAVYSAYHLGIERRVAFKILLPNLSFNDERVIDLFEREAKMAGRLIHENIVDVKDAGRTPDGLAYMVMEWLDGRTLEEEIAASSPLSFERTGMILRQIAAALDIAHSNHVIHRDLKPSNVMLINRPDGREQVKLVDFGIAKVLSDTSSSPVSAAMGTPHYASPEQFQTGGHIDARADIYSLGVMLFQMLTNALPFTAPSIRELVHLHLTAAPPPLSVQRSDAPAAIEALLNRMLAKEVEQRPTRAGEVSEIFDRSLTTPQGVHARVIESGEVIIDKAVTLTEQEHKIIKLISQEHSSGEIAEQLNIKEETVRQYISSILGKLGMPDSHQDPTSQDAMRIASLTELERKIISLGGDGMTHEEIGKRLKIDEGTIHQHVAIIKNKLGVLDRVGLLVFAYRYGLAQPPR